MTVSVYNSTAVVLTISWLDAINDRAYACSFAGDMFPHCSVAVGAVSKQIVSMIFYVSNV